MTDQLPLDPEIAISTLRGEDPRHLIPLLDHVLTTIKARFDHLARSGERQWKGDASVVVIVPSSEVLDDQDLRRMTELLARLGRKASVSLRLIDAHPALQFPDADGQTVYSLNSFGMSAMLRTYAADPQVPTVTFHHVTTAEMVDLTDLAESSTTIRVHATVGTDLAVAEDDWDRPTQLRAELLVRAKVQPGQTEDALLGSMPIRLGTVAEARCALHGLIADGLVVVRDGHHYDQADTEGLGIHIDNSQGDKS